MSLLPIRSLVRKAFLHILRHRRTLFIMFVMPIIQLVLLGYATTTDVEHLHTAVLDYNRTPSVAGTQQEATMLTFLTVFPSVFLGGLFFPLEAMPSWLQALTYVTPLRYILDVIRGMILKGVGLPVLLPQAAALALFGTGVMPLAPSRFQKRLA